MGVSARLLLCQMKAASPSGVLQTSACLIFQKLSIYVVVVRTECAHRMKKCIKCQVTITKKIRQGKRKNSTHPFLFFLYEKLRPHLTIIRQGLN